MTIQPSFPQASDGTPAAEAARVTPMMEQYLEIKAAHPGLLLFYRMGDFYELFFEDAEIASKTLGIVLTKRGKHQGMDIPMCGVPVERSEDYLHRLINAGHRVAVCEQTENPAAARARGNKSVVSRGVVRLVTPGTLTEDTLLDARTNNYLLAIARARGSAGSDRIGLAWIDISTSEFIVTECSTGELAATLSRVNPNEVIVTDALYGDPELGPLLRELPAVTPLTRDVFDSATAERIEVRAFETLLMSFAESAGANVIIRGLRAVSDFEYEFQMAGMNARLNDRIETVFLMSSDRYQFISSRFVKEIGALGGDITHFVSKGVAERLVDRYGKRAKG